MATRTTEREEAPEAATAVEPSAAAEAATEAGISILAAPAEIDARYSRFSPRRITGAWPLFPLVVLFGLNAVDELDRTAFNVLIPDIRDGFGLSNQGALGLVAAIAPVVLILSLPVAHYADRLNRVRMAAVGAATWAVFSFFTGLAPAVAVLLIARAGSGLGKTVVEPTHNSLLADFYPPEVRGRVYYAHRLANSAGQAVGPVAAGLLATLVGWRVPFLLLAVPTVVFVVLALRLKEPVRGIWDRRLAGADEDTAGTEETPLPFGEAWRLLWNVRSLRRVYFSLPFLSASLLGIAAIINLFWEEVYGLNSAQRGLIEGISEPFQVVGILAGGILVQRLLNRDPSLVIKALAISAVCAAGSLLIVVVSPHVLVAIAGRILFATMVAALVPGIYAIGSLVLPSRARSLGFAAAGIWGLPGVIFLPIAGGIGDAYGLRAGLFVLMPIYLIGSFILASSGLFTNADIRRNQVSARTQAEARRERLAGRGKLLLVRDLDVSYEGTQVLFNVDFEVGDGEIVALLGTNGAGKSTLLKAISGLLTPDNGATLLDGADITTVDAVTASRMGIVQMPGGRGVFPSLTVAENLRAAGWLYRRDARYVREANERVLDYFPILRDRWDTPAGSLSGGQQQMLSLGMAFVAQPKLLMIDELTLGLAPTVVDQLLEIVRAIHANGTAIVLVEQSVNVALRIAERAVFLEKGEVRFSGPTSELLERGDILRSVYLKGAASLSEGANGRRNGGGNGSKRSRATAKKAADQAAAAKLADPAVLETFGLTKSYGGVVAVHDVSITLHDGEILGLIGPNGAGKTTLMDLISGFQELDRGRIVLNGRDVTEWPSHKRASAGIGRSFQDARLWPSMTLKENLAVALERSIEAPDAPLAAFGLPIARQSERDIADRSEELIEMLGLDAFRDKFVGELSTGSRRMVEIAAMLAHEPTTLLLDEPSSGIAQREAEALGPVLRSVQDQMKCSILIIEHDMPLITSLADHIVALDQGAVVTVGRPDEVLNHPHVVESYLGGAHDYGELSL